MKASNHQEIILFGKLNQGERFIHNCKTYIKLETVRTKQGDKANAVLLQNGSLFKFKKSMEVIKTTS